ncbi:MAG: hypothetical protein AAGU75_00400 [Bacillota bacterium]
MPPKANALEQVYGLFSRKYIKWTLLLLIISIPINIAVFSILNWTTTLLSTFLTLEQSLNIGMVFMFGGPLGLILSSFFSDKGGRKIPLGVLAQKCYCN